VKACGSWTSTFSWTRHSLERPTIAEGLERLLSIAKQKPQIFEVILVDDTSRLSRKLVDSLRIFEQLQFARIRVVFATQGIDTDSEQAELLVATHGIVDSL